MLDYCCEGNSEKAVIPAYAGILNPRVLWAPAFAEVTINSLFRIFLNLRKIRCLNREGNMPNKIILSVVFLAFLVGCDDGQEIKKITVQEQQVSQSSDTVLYFPGGAGVEFGRKATSERINISPDGRRIKILAYSFDESASEVDLALAQVLEAEGYVKTSPAAENVKLHSVYTKAGYPYVSARYLNDKVGEAESKTILVLSWEVRP